MGVLARNRVPIAIAAVVVIIGGVVGGVLWNRADSLPSNAVLKYDGQVVTVADLNTRVHVLAALYGVTPPKGAAKLAAFDKDAAKSVAVSMILDKAASARHIVISDKAAQTQLNTLINQQLAGGQQAFVEYLTTEGISQNDVLAEIKRQLATSQLAQQVTKNIAPATAAQTQAFYDSHRSSMVSDATRHLLNIVVSTNAQAQQVVTALKTQPFARVAKTWSMDASTRSKGGDLGFVAASELDSSYATAAFAASVGSVFGPVQTKYGWNVGKVLALKSAMPMTFAQISGELQTELSSQAKTAAWRTYLAQLIKGAGVDYASKYRPADPTAPPSVGLPTGINPSPSVATPK
jgi:peptidyl-prolyl cis-trans isomerase C